MFCGSWLFDGDYSRIIDWRRSILIVQIIIFICIASASHFPGLSSLHFYDSGIFREGTTNASRLPHFQAAPAFFSVGRRADRRTDDGPPAGEKKTHHVKEKYITRGRVESNSSGGQSHTRLEQRRHRGSGFKRRAAERMDSSGRAAAGQSQPRYEPEPSACPSLFIVWACQPQGW